jgi:hypothetical protein
MQKLASVPIFSGFIVDSALDEQPRLRQEKVGGERNEKLLSI